MSGSRIGLEHQQTRAAEKQYACATAIDTSVASRVLLTDDSLESGVPSGGEKQLCLNAQAILQPAGKDVRSYFAANVRDLE
jgi:hypothetical protein